MTTKLGKIFAVTVTVLSLGFMGFAAVTVVGGPNFQTDQVEVLDDYVFELTPGENPTWEVKARRSKETVKGSAKSLPEVIVAARQHLDGLQTEQLAALNAEIDAIAPQITVEQELIEIDLKAMQTRVTELNNRLTSLLGEIKVKSDELIKLTDDTQKVRAEAGRRREDVFRLTNQLAEIRTDAFRLQEQKYKLINVLIRLRGSIARTERRNVQLIKAGAKIESDYNK